jgi:hypothetical protein
MFSHSFKYNMDLGKTAAARRIRIRLLPQFSYCCLLQLPVLMREDYDGTSAQDNSNATNWCG